MPTPSASHLLAHLLSPRDELDAAGISHAIVTAGVAPTAAAGCAARVAGRWRVEVGGATSTLFDLASVTKPMTAAAAAWGGVDRALRLRDAIATLADTASADARLELLLAHRAGVASHAPLFAPLLRGEAVDVAASLRVAADARRDDARGPIPPEGFAPVYSDLSYVLAGEVIARTLRARDAGEAIARHVVARLGLEDELGTARDLEARGVDVIARAAPTEDVAWRGGLVRGRVHDENAWALTGAGGSGHAGIFGTVRAVVAFGCAVLDAIDDLAWLVARRPGGTLRAGFDGKSDEGSSAGARASGDAFGHLGFTGTSLWIDPRAEQVVVLLTNRVCPTREHVTIREARPLAHDALFARASSLA